MSHRTTIALLILLAGLLVAPTACAGTTSDTGAGSDAEMAADVDTTEGEDAGEDVEEVADEGAVEDADEEADEDADHEDDDDGDGMGMQNRHQQDEKHAEMLAAGVEQGLITAEDAEFFEKVHLVLDELPVMDEGAGKDADDAAKMAMQRARTDLAVAENMLSQEDADRFTEIHDLLIENGLMDH